MYETIKQNLLQIQEEIAPCKPKIIAITKYFDKDAIICAYQAGLRDFGESRVVEAIEKINALPEEIKSNSTFHFIGHLQTNKVKKVVKQFDYIHSVDSVKLAKCISEAAKELDKTQKILLQINNADEEQKFGMSKDEVFECFEQIKDLPNLEIAGVMNIAPLEIQENDLAQLFEEIVQIKNRLSESYGYDMKEVSMGMSQDYKIAASKGATMLRIGRKLFR